MRNPRKFRIGDVRLEYAVIIMEQDPAVYIHG